MVEDPKYFLVLSDNKLINIDWSILLLCRMICSCLCYCNNLSLLIWIYHCTNRLFLSLIPTCARLRHRPNPQKQEDWICDVDCSRSKGFHCQDDRICQLPNEWHWGTKDHLQ